MCSDLLVSSSIIENFFYVLKDDFSSLSKMITRHTVQDDLLKNPWLETP